MTVALLFIDGVGVGQRDPRVNPLARHAFLLSQFADGHGTALPRNGAMITVDATFGVPGRPQSASNQTALLTGTPAPRIIGKHVLGFPNPSLRELIREHSIIRRMVHAGKRATFANSYPAGYLDALGLRRRSSERADVEIPERARRRLKASATTLAMAAGDVPLRTLDDARAGRGLTHCIDGRRASAQGFGVPQRSPEEAAKIFLELASEVDFALFEHFLADEAGHAQDFAAAEAALGTFDDFARQVVKQKPDLLHLVIVSDHGNVEELSSRQHTLNRVPVLYFGPTPEILREQGGHGGPPLWTLADVGLLLLLRLCEVTE